MPYTQPLRQQILSPDTLTRKVLLALEIFDPLSQKLLSNQVIVAAAGLGQPIVSWSGRFVWLDEGGAWPAEISVDPVGLPFERETAQPPAPPDLAHATPAQRLVRIVLRPTAAADFSGGVTAIRGQLSEGPADPSPPVTDASVQLAWWDLSTNAWIPSPERSAVTSASGEFGVFLRLQPGNNGEPDLQRRLLKVRLQFARPNASRATPDAYPFLADPNAAGRVIDGELLGRDLKLAWANLQPI
ncbi:MAG TPA: hypothetical protein VKT49_11050 [Bryobacteraceae bacterium]|nr:hypothetical protein [Bryobacteraceae bacterium]